jgi:Fanconi-associated nuclease 1
VFCEEYGHRSGGVPDLWCVYLSPLHPSCTDGSRSLWDDDGNVKFSEVKGPGDTLSETQRVWIDLLLTAGVEVEVCKVMTSEDKKAMDELAEENREKRKSGKRGRTVDEDGEDPDEED